MFHGLNIFKGAIARRGRQWQPYFQRTFEIYTKLWKFQQVHRTILESKEHYGLKRWEVGEIASKIGQLYYHYYLRTSETNYLHEAHVFYEAILDRAYFKDVLDAKNPAQMIKKLRYYARFIVVGLLLQRTQHVTKLLAELTALVEEYTKTFKPVDSMEWQMVLQEISAFLEAERKLVPFAINTAQPLPIQSRLPSVRPVALESSKGTLLLGTVLADPKPKLASLRLQQAIIMGNTVQQLKFSELTLDMYRMVLTLEREITKPLPAPTKSGNGPTEGGDDNPPQPLANSLSEPRAKPNSLGLTAVSPRRATLPPPNKHMLFRPTLGQLLIYIANAYKEITENSALLLYLSAEGVKASPAEGGATLGYNGGCATSFRKPVEKAADVADSVAATHCLHPGDIVPFTRKPLFLIIDSTNSQAFKNIPRLFNQPLLCFMSPISSPFRDTAKTGSLMTMFLYSPLVAFCHLADLTELTPETWAQMSEMFHGLEDSIVEVLLSNSNVDAGVKRFLLDDFSRLLIARFILCHMVIASHRLTKDPKNLPSCSPPFPEDIFSSSILVSSLQSLVELTSTGLIYSNLPQVAQSTSPQSSKSPIPGFSPIQPPATLEEKK
ncbi:hypothetical protein DSO57_1026566 [Entomophthora muscae]|uniref:Uncharacterized protein n=1 Tax=Entomophthora muscae TaxID=34485 RepID=A0ACC2UB31_9FUNG|nr:hypothetical protein DSO57_1026566 [Entomophthora muscae]